MLVEFSVENFKSFRDRTTFSMIASNIKSEDKQLDEDNTIPFSTDLRLLTSAAIFGKNASGKSNLGAAFRFMRNFVLYSASGTQSGDAIHVTPFSLNTKTRDMASSFEVVFIIGETQYRYGFEAGGSHIVAEWLYYVPSRREYALFERDEQGIHVNAGYKEGKGLEERTRENALFLSVVAQFNSPKTEEIMGWFRQLAVTSGLLDNDFKAFTAQCLREGRYAAEIMQFVKSIDVDIDDLVAPAPPTMESLPETISDEQKRRIVEGWEDPIYAVHPIYNEDGQVVDSEIFNINDEESQGTRKLIAMSGPLHSALKFGYVMFVDEMDARLHTHMTAAIVKLFNSRHTNPHGAQLIFVTHDTNLLDNTLFRRDQLWFTEKDRQGSTSLVSLSDFQERNNVDFEKRYLGGRYGGVPFIRGLEVSDGAVS